MSLRVTSRAAAPRRARWRALAGAAALLLPAAAGAQADYARAEQLLSWNTAPRVTGDAVDANWLRDGHRFWYRNKTRQGAEYVLVDPARNTRGLLFDHARLAAAMSVANDTAYDPNKLPVGNFRFADDGANERVIEFTTSRKRWSCDITSYRCTARDTTRSEVPYVLSPDRKWEAFVHQHNVWVRPRGGGDSTQVTTDGVQDWSYGLGAPRPYQLVRPQPRRPGIRWSPDSRRLLVSRTDERRVARMHYVSSTHQRPRHYSQPYALPGDSIVPVPGFHILDVAGVTGAAAMGGTGSGSGTGDGASTGAGPSAGTGGGAAAGVRNVAVTLPRVPNQLQLTGSARDSVWSADGRTAYVTYLTRGSKHAFLAAVDAETGAVRVIAGDSARTYVELSQRDPVSWYVTGDGREAIWWSERDGWAHLYRYAADGRLLNQITSGPWAVGAVQHVDEAARQVYFTARGREPGRLVYHAHLYRVGFDGTGLTLLTPEDGDHRISFAPGGKYFVDSWSTIDTPPVSVLRALDGRVIRTLERADVSQLAEIGWRPAQVFTAKARDGVTDLHGVLYLPPDLDSTKRYPVISHIYPGPQVGSVGSWSFKNGGEPHALAQLGFVVVQIDHLGTPLRSKAFHDNYYGNFGDNGLADHVTVIKQLGMRHAYMDLDRVGIFGHSGGGFASTGAMLRYPDFFKVAVSGAGNHDNRSYNIYWAEKYQGLLQRDSLRRSDNFAGSANAALAANLKGKLLLMHGDMDDNVHPAMTIQVADALIKANRSFDLLIAPNRAHGLNEPYFIRRRWDYFVEHLLGARPPQDYQIVRPGGGGGGGGDEPADRSAAWPDPMATEQLEPVAVWGWWAR